MATSQIHVIPSSSMVDEEISISVTYLESGSKVTLRSYMAEGKYRYEAHAHYIADKCGRIRLSHDASLGGSFKGIEPMGLFSLMQPSPGQRYGIRYAKKDVTTPLRVTLSLHQGHIDVDTLQNDSPITSSMIQRWYMAPGVERIHVRHGRLRGSVLKPKGSGPFPGIIDMFGHAGGLLDFRAALLSSHGFVVFSLAFYAYDDLPSDINDIELEYVDEAVNWFSKEPYITPGGIGVCGVSFGGTVALLMASRFPNKVTAAALISSPIAVIKPPLKYKGKTMPYLEWDHSKEHTMSDGSIYAAGCYTDIRDAAEETKIKIENIRKMLFIVGEDDHDFEAGLHASEAVKRLQAYGRNPEDYDVISYPGTGHLIEPPFRPVTTISYHSIAKVLIDWGGNILDHSKAQQDSWLRILDFFRSNIGHNHLSVISTSRTSKL